MQIAIDNAKRKYDIDLNAEIGRIKKDIMMEKRFPLFWQITKKDKRKMRSDEARRQRDRDNRRKIREHLNVDLVCPMNYLYTLKLKRFRDSSPTIPMSEFWVKHELGSSYRQSKKVERLIQDYSLELFRFNAGYDDDDYFLLRSDFDDLIRDIKAVYLSKNYLGLMSWLINRAFFVGAGVRSKRDVIDSTLRTNKSLLLKVLYTVNPEVFLKCFVEKVENDGAEGA